MEAGLRVPCCVCGQQRRVFAANRRYVLGSHLPKQPHLTKADKYVIVSMLAIIGVAIQSCLIKMVLDTDLLNHKDPEDARWMDTLSAIIYFLFWFIPHFILFCFRHRFVQD
eukprot:COSAG01_NODE_41819_length_446_cov_38.268012_1_plen_110_part_10